MEEMVVAGNVQKDIYHDIPIEYIQRYIKQSEMSLVEKFWNEVVDPAGGMIAIHKIERNLEKDGSFFMKIQYSAIQSSSFVVAPIPFEQTFARKRMSFVEKLKYLFGKQYKYLP